MSRTVPPLLAVFLSGCCCLGSCPDGNTQGELFQASPPRGTRLETVKYPVQRVRIAPGSKHELEIGESSFSIRNRSSSLTEAAFEDPKVARVSRTAGNTVTFEGVAEGTTHLAFSADVDGELLSDRFEVAVTAPNVLQLSNGCTFDKPYWVGMPAFVRYEMLYYSPENYAAYPWRIWGLGDLPLAAHPQLELRSQSQFELRFDGPDEPQEIVLASSLEPIDHYNVPKQQTTLKFEEPPRIKGVRYIGVNSGQIYDQPYAHQNLVSTFRAFPVGVGGEQMCNTAIPVQVRSKTEGSCLVRARRAARKVEEFSTVANAVDGIFELKGLEHGKCVLELVVMTAALKLLEEGLEELVVEQNVTFYSPGSGGGGLDLPSLGGIDIDDD